ncbi:MAG: DUF6455 family protein [Nevskia sp.]|nr:DUF6455 family protein [Nevskia sp.]
MNASLLQTVDLYVAVLLAAFGMSFLTLTIVVLLDSDAVRELAHAWESKQLDRVRMGRMLALRGIDRRIYLRGTPMSEVRHQVARCRNCSQQSRCDADLAAGTPTRAGYCPNARALDTLAVLHRHGSAQTLQPR